MMSVGLAVAEGVPVPLALLLALAVAFGVLVCAVATAALLSALEALCSWPSLHPVNPEQANRVRVNAA